MPRLAVIATIGLLCAAGCGGGGSSSNLVGTGLSGSGSTRSFSVTNQGSNGVASTVSLTVANAQTLFNTGNSAFNNLAGPNGGPPPSFDFGLPFFFGQTVFTGIEGQIGNSAPNGYVAYSTGGSTGGANNVLAILVNSGPIGQYVDGLFASVTICVPATATCQTIPGVLVDTGSSGLRLVKSVVQINLPTENAIGGGSLVECAQFVDGFVWGPMKIADIKMAGESANSVPIQIIDDSSAPAFSVPTACSSTGVNESSIQPPNGLLANGILGVGNFRQDCGPGCVSTTQNHFYFSCSSQSCVDTLTTLAQQAQNPVWRFSSDNNGSLIQLPQIPAGGASSASGSLIFGIGTQPNNGLGSASVLALAQNGTFTTTFNSTNYSGSVIDSGSNGIFFLTSSLTGMPLCSGSPEFYCPQ